MGCYYSILRWLNDGSMSLRGIANWTDEPQLNLGYFWKPNTLFTPPFCPLCALAEYMFQHWRRQLLLPEDFMVFHTWTKHQDGSPTHRCTFQVNYHVLSLTPSHFLIKKHTHTPNSKKLRSTTYVSLQFKTQTEINCIVFFFLMRHILIHLVPPTFKD